MLLAPTPSDAARTALVDLARLTLDLELEPESAGVFAESFAASRGLLRDLEDATPTPFGPPPRGHEGGQVPTVGWGRAPHPHDFLGSEFLLDLWCRAERGAEDEVEAAITEALDMRGLGSGWRSRAAFQHSSSLARGTPGVEERQVAPESGIDDRVGP